MAPCEHCKIEDASVKHHISYFPQLLIKLCFRCHQVIHKSKLPMYDKYKKYSKNDSKWFYYKNTHVKHVPRKKQKRKKIFWMDIPLPCRIEKKKTIKIEKFF